MSSLAILDRALLAHNLYRILLKPKGHSCYLFRDFDPLRKFLEKEISVGGLVIGGNSWKEEEDDRYFRFFQKETPLKNLPKLFLFRHGEKKRKLKFQYLEKAFILERPCHPKEFYEVLARW